MRSLDAVELFRLCAYDTANSEAWSELLRRYSGRLSYFLKGTLRQLSASAGGNPVLVGGLQENDLFQNAIIRLVENNCAAMKRFTGTTENELLAYLAVICRSSVLDVLRRNNAAKRRHEGHSEDLESAACQRIAEATKPNFDREILIRELLSLTESTLESHSEGADRDRLVFDLHFFHGLSCGQISQCKGINLSRTGVEKLLKRMITRVQLLASAGKANQTPL